MHNLIQLDGYIKFVPRLPWKSLWCFVKIWWFVKNKLDFSIVADVFIGLVKYGVDHGIQSR